MLDDDREGVGRPRTRIQAVLYSVTHGLTEELPRAEGAQEMDPNLDVLNETLCRSMSIQPESMNEEQM